MKATKLFSILATFFLSISFFSTDLSAQWTPAPDDPGTSIVSTVDRVFITNGGTQASLVVNTQKYGFLVDATYASGYIFRGRHNDINKFTISGNGDIDMKGSLDAIGDINTTGVLNAAQIKTTGQVRIGDMGDVTNINNLDSYGLLVNSGIMSKRVKCALVDNWSDYVFEEDYELNSLKEVENFITANKHLPNVPSAKTVETNGIDVATMDATLLRQIEELWLHTIELNKEKEALETENDDLESKYNALLQRVEALETK